MTASPLVNLFSGIPTQPLSQITPEPPTELIPIWHGKPPLTVIPEYRQPSVVEEFDYALWLPIAAVIVALTVLIAWWMQ